MEYPKVVIDGKTYIPTDTWVVPGEDYARLLGAYQQVERYIREALDDVKHDIGLKEEENRKRDEYEIRRNKRSFHLTQLLIMEKTLRKVEDIFNSHNVY